MIVSVASSQIQQVDTTIGPMLSSLVNMEAKTQQMYTVRGHMNVQ